MAESLFDDDRHVCSNERVRSRGNYEMRRGKQGTPNKILVIRHDRENISRTPPGAPDHLISRKLS